MKKREILLELREKSRKSISECLNAYNLTNNIEDAFKLLFVNEISSIKKRIKVTDEKLISRALSLSINNIQGAISILVHSYDMYSKDKIRYPEFNKESLKNKKYDDASWHYDGDFPDNIPNKNAATHIGMFITWCLENNLISDDLKKDAKNEIRQVKERKMTGAEFLLNICDEKMMSEDLNEIGNEFTQDYYEYNTEFEKKFNTYGNDFADVFNLKAEQNNTEYESIYHVEDTFENFDLIKVTIDLRFEEWKVFRNKTYS